MRKMKSNFLFAYALSVKILLFSTMRNPASVFQKSLQRRDVEWSIKRSRVSGRLCKILSRELRNAAKWRRGIRCRGGFAGMSLDCRLENAWDAVRDVGETRGRGRLRRNQGRGYGGWNNPYLRAGLTLLYIGFFARDAARLSRRSRRSREIEMLSEVILLPWIKLMIGVDLIAIRNRVNEWFSKVKYFEESASLVLCWDQ